MRQIPTAYIYPPELAAAFDTIEEWMQEPSQVLDGRDPTRRSRGRVAVAFDRTSRIDPRGARTVAMERNTGKGSIARCRTKSVSSHDDSRGSSRRIVEFSRCKTQDGMTNRRSKRCIGSLHPSATRWIPSSRSILMRVSCFGFIDVVGIESTKDGMFERIPIAITHGVREAILVLDMSSKDLRLSIDAVLDLLLPLSTSRRPGDRPSPSISIAFEKLYVELQEQQRAKRRIRRKRSIGR